jgi:SAM-dependent methyltransferase
MTGKAWLFHRLTAKSTPPPDNSNYHDFLRDYASTIRYLDRFGQVIDLAGKSILDIGCGTGTLCIEAARRGATRIVGVDLQLIDVADAHLKTHCAELAAIVEFVRTDGSLQELGEEQFDMIFSKDSFEHYADPEAFVHVMTRLLRPGGELVVGFGPLWKAPGGGHIGYMTKVPWMHLIFPESVIMAERRRFRPQENAARFEDIVGGLNKMTFRRFETIMSASGLECVQLRTNVSDHPAVKIMSAISRFPPLREYFTNNVYSTWAKTDLSRHLPDSKTSVA